MISTTVRSKALIMLLLVALIVCGIIVFYSILSSEISAYQQQIKEISITSEMI